MQENRIIHLLDEIKPIVARYHDEAFKQGKEFNIFLVQGIASDEVKVCRFIRELLDPKGSHGQGIFFLHRFMKTVLKTDEFTDEEYRHASVIQEETINQARRIDLVIHIKSRLFPIEVKIYADDQANQCRDYYLYASRIDPQAKIFYLTLDGHEPSDISISKSDTAQVKLDCISFADEILVWLGECINAPEMDKIQPVKEILGQFENVIRKLTGMQKGNMMNDITDVIESSSENIMAAIQITHALPDIKARFMQKIFDLIKSHMAEFGITESKDYYVKECEDYYKTSRITLPHINYNIPVSDKALEGKIVLSFEIHQRLYFGIRPIEAKAEEAAKYIREHLTPPSILTHENDANYYWWAYLHKCNNANFKQENIDYLNLFDNVNFEEYMKGIYSSIDMIVNLIRSQKHNKS
ncbi:PD-(D/E)XK nuclease family protein [Aristaeella lactis]|uniref:PD-(D/E)XK nuclease superfamily protein n=1 Tax=Aristaeella lactis TaxID=3046383 RepID=A0AC61PL99_9FIRM|nr:PD-(D/E)XK nuclease family protein [Aristaeella lactis]QUA52186.1 PD-(D/E)XK nuclease family protein [Aristaeella lactis]SMC58532.1 PD-(D/E)XK nuclease superfamily protein [Aristaeella lactis]